MTTSKVTYLGDLRTSSVHIQSGSEIISDAPIDNNGKGEAFSPTDTVANGLASCMFTMMGIKARDMEIDLSGSTAEVTKVMAAEPRRISEIHVTFNLDVLVDVFFFLLIDLGLILILDSSYILYISFEFNL